MYDISMLTSFYKYLFAIKMNRDEDFPQDHIILSFILIWYAFILNTFE